MGWWSPRVLSLSIKYSSEPGQVGLYELPTIVMVTLSFNAKGHIINYGKGDRHVSGGITKFHHPFIGGIADFHAELIDGITEYRGRILPNMPIPPPVVNFFVPKMVLANFECNLYRQQTVLLLHKKGDRKLAILLGTENIPRHWGHFFISWPFPLLKNYVQFFGLIIKLLSGWRRQLQVFTNIDQ